MIEKAAAKPYIIYDIEFEWNDDKAASNYSRHGVTFETARSIFNDPLAIELIDDRNDYGEDRFILIGIADGGRLLVVVYTVRGDAIRIISTRGAVPSEQREYHEQDC